MNVKRLGLVAGAFAIASFSFLFGQWVYGFSQVMWLEDELGGLGGSDGPIFEYLVRTPPGIVPLLWVALVVLAVSTVTVLACIVMAQRGTGSGAKSPRPRLSQNDGAPGAASTS